MKTLLAVCAVAVVALSPLEAVAGACQTCTQSSDCGGGLCVQHIGNLGCGANARLCCPGQACALSADGGASCVASGTCTIVSAAGGGMAGGGTAGGGTAGGVAAAGGTAGSGSSGGGSASAGGSANAGGPASMDGGVGTTPMTPGCGCSGFAAGPLTLAALLLLRRRRA